MTPLVKLVPPPTTAIVIVRSRSLSIRIYDDDLFKLRSIIYDHDFFFSRIYKRTTAGSFSDLWGVVHVLPNVSKIK
jgi:hypothetical protein